MEKKRKLEIEHRRINEIEFDSPHPTIDEDKDVRNSISDSPGENRLLNEHTTTNLH